MKQIAFVSLLLAGLLTPVLATEVAAERVVSGDRWFEIEFVLFQRTPAADLIESFPLKDAAPQPARYFDVLKPFYQPDIQPLLQQLALCPTPQKSEPTDSTVDWRQYLPSFEQPKIDGICIFEPQPPLWQQSLFSRHSVIDTLPMPAQLAQRPGGTGQHRNGPYLMASQELTFGDIVQRLRRQSDIELLLHAGYRQAPVTERRSIPSRWYAGKNLTAHFSGRESPSQSESPLRPGQISLVRPGLMQRIEQHYQRLLNQNEPAQDYGQRIDLRELSPEQLASPWWQLDGFIRLHLDHYLFVNTDFVLTSEIEPGQLLPHRIQFSRRVISGEMHYIDHPKLGMILQIRRFQPPLQAAQ